MCEHWWDEELLKEQAERLRRREQAPAEPGREHQQPERKPQQQPDPVPA